MPVYRTEATIRQYRGTSMALIRAAPIPNTNRLAVSFTQTREYYAVIPADSVPQNYVSSDARTEEVSEPVTNPAVANTEQRQHSQSETTNQVGTALLSYTPRYPQTFQGAPTPLVNEPRVPRTSGTMRNAIFL